jgi:ketosteroid isomerase-like protein
VTAEENVELARRAYDAINRDDLEGFVSLIDPDVEFGSLIAEAEGKTYRGHDGVRQWWRDVVDALGGMNFRAQEIRPVGEDGVLAKIVVKVEVGGVPVEQTMWQAARAGERGPFWWQGVRTEEEGIAEIERHRRGDR